MEHGCISKSCFSEEEVFYWKREDDAVAEAVWCGECGSNLYVKVLHRTIAFM